MDNPKVVILIAFGLTLMIGGIAGHFNRYTEKDWKALRDEIKQGLSNLKQWARRDDAIPIALLSGGSLVIGISWALS